MSGKKTYVYYCVPGYESTSRKTPEKYFLLCQTTQTEEDGGMTLHGDRMFLQKRTVTEFARTISMYVLMT